MKLRMVFYFLAIAAFVFFRFYNHHLIMKYSAEKEKYSRQYETERVINGELRLQFNELTSRERIEKLATDKLGMFYPDPELASVRYVRESRQNQMARFTLIDYLVPSVEAMPH